MQRLFAGTPWDRPSTCELCGRPQSDCQCPPPAPSRLPPEKQTARLRIEKRPKGKMVTVVDGLDPAENDLDALASQLKARCGGGGTVKEGRIELQGSHLEAVRVELSAVGYRIKG